MNRIGVLALQGAFVEHVAALRRLGVEAFPVRLPGELRGLSGLVIPGGESTAIGKLVTEYSLLDKLQRLIARGLPVLGTCAGMVLLAKKVSETGQESLRLMDIEVRRNAFGRQVDSFETDLEVPVLGPPPFHAVFIRAPRIESTGGDVEILASLPDGTAVAARQRNLIATAFHPELTNDLRFHAYFMNIVDGNFKENTAEVR